jgi:WD40 repeat protein
MIDRPTGPTPRRARAWRFCLLVIAIGLTLPGGSSAAEVGWSAIITQAKPAVVRIIAETQEGTSSGSGFLVAEDGLVLTAAHVIEGATRITVVVLETQEYQATVVQSDSDTDVAVLRITASGLAYLTLGDSNALAYYEEISALGYSVPTIGVGFIPARGYFIGLRASPSATYVQFEASPLDHGHSGGPVIDATGHVVGLIVGVVADPELGVFNKLAVATGTVVEVLARPLPPCTLIGHTKNVNSVAFSPGGEVLVSGSDDDTVKMWDVATGRVVRTLEGLSHAGPTHWIGEVDFSPNGTLLASGSGDATVNLWDVATGTVTHTLAGHIWAVTSVAFSPDGRLLASGSRDNTLKLWDVATGLELRTLVGHTSQVSTVAFSPDGELLASGSDDSLVKLWDVVTGQEVRSLVGHTGSVTSVAFSPDGTLLASGAADNTIRLWDATTGALVQTLARHTKWVTSVAFSPDGKLLASGSRDNTLKLWDVATGLELRTLIGHTNEVWAVAFSLDGTLLASGSWDDTVKLWDVSDLVRR